MNNVECKNGHIYDADIYGSNCPYCQRGSSEYIYGQTAGSEWKTVAGFGQQDPFKTSIGGNQGKGGDEEWKTVGPGDGDQDVTVARLKKQQGFLPVVGWIVCINGPDKGNAYQLYDKRNRVGRSEEMDVCIQKDDTISRSQLIITYDAKHVVFQLTPSERATNPIYKNGELTEGSTRLVSYDCIEFGMSTYVFVSLCNEHFNWQSGIVS